MENKYKWTLIVAAPNGHRFFKDERSGRISIADDSGTYPDETDDGVLWLDFSRKLVLDFTAKHMQVVYPVIRDRDNRDLAAGDGFGCVRHICKIWLAAGGKTRVEGMDRDSLRTLASMMRMAANDMLDDLEDV
jgi:hypothetical protein